MSSRLSRMPAGWAAHTIVMSILLAVAFVAHAARLLRRMLLLRVPARPAGRRRVLLVGTFYNENWLRSHAYPLCAARDVERVYVVTDKPLFAREKITYVCPSPLLTRFAGRIVARAWSVTLTVIRERPDVLMGYHIMPNALICLAAGSLIGARTVYQMTGGPLQIIGGGNGSENRLLRMLGGPSATRERLMFHLVRMFDWVAVRGRKAVEFVEQNNLSTRCVIIPGSVDCARFMAGRAGSRRYDLVSVGRLVACKRYDRFIEILAELRKLKPDLSAAIVGDGPLTEDLRRLATDRGLEGCLHLLGQRDDVPAVLAESRLFALTSESEGLSIAMVEAMAAGLPAVVPDVGDLGDVVREGETGLLIDPLAPAATAQRIASLLADTENVEVMGRRARREILEYNAVEAVTRRWEQAFTLLDAAAGPTGRVPGDRRAQPLTARSG